MTASEQWGWDLHQGQAVRWDQRGPGEDVLGPYPSKEAAEHWREQVEQRNERWDGDDDAWNDDGGD